MDIQEELRDSERRYKEGWFRGIQRQLFGVRYEGAVLSDVRLPIKDQEFISDWMKKKKYFLVFLGSPGSGKTELCSAMIPWIKENFNHFRYYNERSFLTSVRNSIDESRGDYLDHMKYLIDDDIVMLDDIGSSGVTDWRVEVLFEALDYRYSSTKPTIFTSNLTRKEFEEKYGKRFASRLFAKENTIIELHKAPDLRQEIDAR